MMIDLRLHIRRSRQGEFSIEGLYKEVASCLPGDIEVRWVKCKSFSKGLFPRLLDAIRACWQQGDVNHVTGDVHYLTYFLSSRRTILTIHDFVLLERLSGVKRFSFWLLWYWLPVKKCAAIVVISTATRDQLHSYINCDSSKVRLIYNPFAERFTPGDRVFDETSPRILHIGGTENKNFERHVLALNKIDCTFVILGLIGREQKYFLNKNDIKHEIYSELDDADVVLLYQNCDMLLFASTYEGFGLPLIEAQAVGIPVITSSISSMPEVAGEGALLVDPYNVDAIRKAVRLVIDDRSLRENLVSAGFVNVERFRTQNIAAEYADLYREVADKCA